MARADHQQQWRSNTPNKRIEVYLPVGALSILDKRTRAKAFRGRGETIADLLRQSTKRELDELRDHAPDLAEMVDKGDDVNSVYRVYEDRLKTKPKPAKKSHPHEYEPTQAQAEMDKFSAELSLLVAPSHFSGLNEFALLSLSADYKKIRHLLDSLTKAMSKRALTAFIQLLKYQSAFFNSELKRKLPEAIKEKKAELDKREKEIAESYKKMLVQSQGMRQVLTDKECKFLLSFAHPDRAPKDMETKFTKAFQILKKAI